MAVDLQIFGVDELEKWPLWLGMVVRHQCTTKKEPSAFDTGLGVASQHTSGMQRKAHGCPRARAWFQPNGQVIKDATY